MKLTKKDVKIFQGVNVKIVLARMLKQGFLPLSLTQVTKLRKQGIIPKQWYDTRTILYRGKRRNATIKELQNIQKFYERGGCLVFAGNFDHGNYLFGSNLSFNGRFVGVKK